MPPVRCKTCGGSGTVTRLIPGPYVEEGGVPQELPLEMCDMCLGSGYLTSVKEGR